MPDPMAAMNRIESVSITYQNDRVVALSRNRGGLGGMMGMFSGGMGGGMGPGMMLAPQGQQFPAELIPAEMPAGNSLPPPNYGD